VEDLIKKCLSLLCDPADAERAFVKFEHDDSVVLVINNYGGISNLELGALTDEILTQLCTFPTHQPFLYRLANGDNQRKHGASSLSGFSVVRSKRHSMHPASRYLSAIYQQPQDEAIHQSKSSWSFSMLPPLQSHGQI